MSHSEILCKRTKWGKQPYFRKDSEPCPFNQDRKTPKIDPQLVNQLLAGRKTAGEIEDLLKDLRKAFIESALDGELTHLLGYEKHDASGRNSGNVST